jgi:predicted negative regulator of RcsB-dependent stress response
VYRWKKLCRGLADFEDGVGQRNTWDSFGLRDPWPNLKDWFVAGSSLPLLHEELSHGIRARSTGLNRPEHNRIMPTVPPPSRDAALETRVFWERFKYQIVAALIILLIALVGFTGYRFYSDRRAATASALLASAKGAREYEQLIARYPDTPAGADAYLLLAAAQRREKKFAEANATLQVFITRNPNHEFVSTTRMSMATNLESMGKTDEALSMYQQIASSYPNSFNAPLALLSQVYLLKAKNRAEEARRICETILTQYRTSFWAGEAFQELRLLKPSGPSEPPAAATIPQFLARPPVEEPQAAPTTPQAAPPPAPKPPR